MGGAAPWPGFQAFQPLGDSAPCAVCLSVQELQCDVSVEEDSRQEWTFTLYDFDNNGKVTREVSVPA